MSENGERRYQDSLLPRLSQAIDLGHWALRWRKLWADDLEIRTGSVTEDPVDGTDIVNKDYVDGVVTGTLTTVEAADGTPSYSPVTTLQFDEVDGFVVTNPSAGTVRLDLASIPVTILAGSFADLGSTLTGTLAIADGGTAATTAAGARSNLDVPSNTEAILDTLIDAKGDLISATAADTPARLAVGDNGDVLTADSSTATGLVWATPAAAGGLQSMQVFTTSDTWNRPAGITKVLVQVLGGGAGGGGTAGVASGNATSSGGGGGGGCAIVLLDVSAISSSTVTVGGGGAGGAAGANTGTNGTASSWDDSTNTVTGNGGVAGSGGTTNATAPGGSGGSGTATGGFVVVGGSGVGGFFNSGGVTSISASGGGSHLGGGATGPGANTSGAAASANTGGGGSGALDHGTSTDHAGGAGGSGIVIVYEYA